MSLFGQLRNSFVSRRDVQDGVESAAMKLRKPALVSFEFFPPNDAEMEKTLWSSIQRLAPLAPRFVSVTYGADGSTRERTHNVVMRILKETPLTPAPHLTCIGAPREEILDIARAYWQAHHTMPAAIEGYRAAIDRAIVRPVPRVRDLPPHLLADHTCLAREILAAGGVRSDILP